LGKKSEKNRFQKLLQPNGGK